MDVVVYWRCHQSDCLGSTWRMARAGKGNWAVAREYCETSSSYYCFERLWRGVVLVDGTAKLLVPCYACPLPSYISMTAQFPLHVVTASERCRYLSDCQYGSLSVICLIQIPLFA